MTPIESAFVGWLRVTETKDGEEWMEVCRGEGWGACWRQLLIAAEDLPARSVEMLVNQGRHPDARRKPR